MGGQFVSVVFNYYSSLCFIFFVINIICFYVVYGKLTFRIICYQLIICLFFPIFLIALIFQKDNG